MIEEMLKKYALEAIKVSPEYPMLIDRFLEDALEAEVDALSDGKDTFVAAIMEHIELAGIHSGDSACVIPTRTIKDEHIETIKYLAASPDNSTLQQQLRDRLKLFFPEFFAFTIQL